LYDKVSEKVPTYKIYSIRGLVLNMTEVLRRYKMILIILGLSLVIAFLTFAIFVQKPEKVPSRGIFVFENTTDEKSFIKVLTEKTL
jgi:capsular polysaccharide biosynthesis protein